MLLGATAQKTLRKAKERIHFRGGPEEQTAPSLAETRPVTSYYAPPAPPAPAASYYAPPPPAGPRGEAEVLLREMGISPHLADLFVQQEISRDVAQAVERADLEGLLSEPDIQKFLRWQRVH